MLLIARYPARERRSARGCAHAPREVAQRTYLSMSTIIYLPWQSIRQILTPFAAPATRYDAPIRAMRATIEAAARRGTNAIARVFSNAISLPACLLELFMLSPATFYFTIRFSITLRHFHFLRYHAFIRHTYAFRRLYCRRCHYAFLLRCLMLFFHYFTRFDACYDFLRRHTMPCLRYALRCRFFRFRLHCFCLAIDCFRY